MPQDDSSGNWARLMRRGTMLTLAALLITIIVALVIQLSTANLT